VARSALRNRPTVGSYGEAFSHERGTSVLQAFSYERGTPVGGADRVPLSSELGTCKTVKARFWPWLSGKTPFNVLSCSLFARQVARIAFRNSYAASVSVRFTTDRYVNTSAGLFTAKDTQTHRATSLIRDSPPLGPYSRPMPSALRWSYGGDT
jgi:hypothetical protein